MTLPALLGVLATLGLVLGLLAVAMRALRRYATGASGGRGRLPLEVVQRLALGPKQGIAVVRVGERLLAVSLGEGGVRPLAELGDAEQAMLAGGGECLGGVAELGERAHAALAEGDGEEPVADADDGDALLGAEGHALHDLERDAPAAAARAGRVAAQGAHRDGEQPQDEAEGGEHAEQGGEGHASDSPSG